MKRRIFSLIVILIFAFVSCGTDVTDPDVYDVIVVGAGGGGLCAASQLARAGKKVLIIEQHYKVGGYMTDFKRGDYTFEISLHAMDNLNPGRVIESFLKEIGVYDKLKLVKADPMYRVYFPNNNEINLPADVEKCKKMLIKRFPEQKESIDNFFDVTEDLDEVVDAGTHIMNGNYCTGLWKMIKQPWILIPLIKHWDSNAAEFMDEYIKDEKLLGVLTTLTGMLGDSLESLSGIVFAGMWNGYHRGGMYNFEGGSQSITDALEEMIKKNGGEILLSTRVTKIVIEDGLATAVKTKDGKTFKCRYVISNANAPDTFFKLIGEKHLPEDYVEKLNKMEIGPSAFVVYLGVNKDYREYYPGHLHEIMVCHSIIAKENFKAWHSYDISKLPYGVLNYSKLNPNAAPKGKNVIALTTLMPYDWNDGWKESKGKDVYKKLKTDVAMKLVKRTEKYLPGLASHIEVMEVATPRTLEHYTSNPKGSLFGWTNTVEQSLLKRLPQETPIENLYLAGAWTLPCGGQSVVLMSGYTAANMILDMDD